VRIVKTTCKIRGELGTAGAVFTDTRKGGGGKNPTEGSGGAKSLLPWTNATSLLRLGERGGTKKKVRSKGDRGEKTGKGKQLPIYLEHEKWGVGKTGILGKKREQAAVGKGKRRGNEGGKLDDGSQRKNHQQH